MSPSETTPSETSGAVESVPAPEDLGDSVMEQPTLDDDAPQTRLQKVEIGEPESASNLDDTGAEPESEEELLAPAQQSENDSDASSDKGDADADDDSVKATEAGWRIRWNPVYAPHRI